MDEDQRNNWKEIVYYAGYTRTKSGLVSFLCDNDLVPFVSVWSDVKFDHYSKMDTKTLLNYF